MPIRYTATLAYQMLAYCTALNVPVGWLVYAEGRGSAFQRRIRNTDISIIEYPLDLTPTQLTSSPKSVASPTVPGTAQSASRIARTPPERHRRAVATSVPSGASTGTVDSCSA